MATGTIDQLNFEVLLHDDKFNAQIKVDIENAKKLNMSVSQYLTAKKKEAAVVAQVERARREHLRTIQIENNEYGRQSSILRQLSTLAGTYFSIQGAQKFLRSLIDITGQFEVQKMALTSMLQSSELADKIFNQYRQLALNSPYTFQDFTKFGKQLTAFNIDPKDLVSTTKMLADVAAGLGVDMGRIILAYGQVKSAGVLKGTELRQFTEAGVPILDSLAKQIEETTGKAVKLGDVFAMISKKQIPFEMVEKAFKDMTAEGGRFYNMQEVLVETLQGKIGKLRDTWQQMLYDLGRSENVNKVLKGGIDAITRLISDYETLGQRISMVVAYLATYKGALLALEVASGSFVKENHKIIMSLEKIGTWIKGNPYALLAAAAAAVGVAAAKSIIDYRRSANMMRDAQRAQKKAYDETTISITSEREELKRLVAIASDEKRSMTERKSAIDVINAQYGEYLKNLGIEKVSVDNLRTSYDDLSDAISNKYLQQLRESTVGNAETAKNDARSALNAFNADFIRNTTITIGKNKGKMYGPQGIGMIQAEVERFIEEHPLYDADALYRGLAGVYKKYGLDIDSKSYKAGKLYKVAYEYAESSKILKKSEQDFGAFVKGYQKDMADFQKTEDNATPTNTNIAGGGAMKDRTTAIINGIKKDITTLQQWKDIYDKLAAEPLLGDDGAKALMKAVFGIDGVDFTEQIGNKLSELDSKFRGHDGITEYIDGIKASIGKDTASDLMRLIDAFKKLAEARDKYDLKDFGTEGTGAFYDLSKAISDYKTKIEEVDAKYRNNLKLLAATQAGDEKSLNALREALGEKAWKKYVEEGESAFKDLADAEKAAILSSTQDRIKSIASTYVKEVTQGLDMKEWGDKSMSQVRYIETKLKALRSQGGAIWEDDDQLAAAGISMDEFVSEYERLIDDMLKNVEDEKIKKTLAGIKEILGLLGNFGGIFKSIGDKVNNSFLSGLGKAIEIGKQLSSIFAENEDLLKNMFSQKLANNATETGEKISKEVDEIVENAVGGFEEVAKTTEDVEGKVEDVAESTGKLVDSVSIITMAIKFILLVVQLIAEEIEQNYERQLALNEAEKEYRDTLREIARMKHEGYFGDDALALLATNWNEATKAAQTYKDTLAKDNGKTTVNSWWGIKTMFGNLSDLSKEFPEIFNPDGSVNMDFIKAYKEVFLNGKSGFQKGGWGLSDELKVLLDELIRTYDEMTEATKAFADSVKGIFGTLADTIADGMVDAFLDTGDALGNLDKSFEDFGETVARTMLKSMLSAKMMEQFETRLNTLAESYMKELYASDRETADMKFAEMLGTLAQDMKTFAEGTGDFANSFLSAMQNVGLLRSGNEETETLANGIKGITEDTANLLASYLNAVRADVSGMRMLADAGWKDVNSILGFVGVLPTLNDYMAQVAASNYEIAQSNQQILSEIQSVITSASGRRAIAVDVQ